MVLEMEREVTLEEEAGIKLDVVVIVVLEAMVFYPFRVS